MHKRYWIDCILSIFQKERKKQKKDRQTERRWKKKMEQGKSSRISSQTPLAAAAA